MNNEYPKVGNMDLKHGTTNLALKFDGGVIIAADQRASMGYTVASPSVKKLLQIDDRNVMSIAGLPSDAFYLGKLLKAQIRLYELNRDRRISSHAVANLLATILHNQYRTGFPFFVGLLLAGYDEKGGHVYNYDASGSITDDPYTATGSGTAFSLGALEAMWREGLSEEEAIKVALTALRSSVLKDIASGDGMNLYVIDKDGARELTKDQIKEALGDRYPFPQ
ncbi:MAG: proteasome subunit beta [Candidatus Kariarchaeaceae archaeon]|jgi:proteasome beta subunit